MSTVMEEDQVYAIAAEVFAAMVDGDVGPLQPWFGELETITDPLIAWVDLHGEWSGRAALTTSTPVAHDLARALLGMEPDEEVSDLDLVDAFGEVANVVGGNLKSLLPTQGTLSLPQVATAVPDVLGAFMVQELQLSWRGRLLVVTVWMFG